MIIDNIKIYNTLNKIFTTKYTVLYRNLCQSDFTDYISVVKGINLVGKPSYKVELNEEFNLYLINDAVTDIGMDIIPCLEARNIIIYTSTLQRAKSYPALLRIIHGIYENISKLNEVYMLPGTTEYEVNKYTPWIITTITAINIIPDLSYKDITTVYDIDKELFEDLKSLEPAKAILLGPTLKSNISYKTEKVNNM